MTKETSWINLRPGVAAEVEYDPADYQMAYEDEDEVPVRLTGRVRVTREHLFASECLIDPVTGRELP